MNINKFYSVEEATDGYWQSIEIFCLKKPAESLYKRLCRMDGDKHLYRLVRKTVEHAGTTHEKVNELIIAIN